jgi:hypothetical protein
VPAENAGTIAESLADRDALGVECVGDTADRGLRAFLVNVPAPKCSIGLAFITISGGWMIGPAFISAPDKASPHSSITPRKGRPITSSAWSAVLSGNTPTGSRLARMVMATRTAVLPRQPGQGAGLGELTRA